MAERFWIKPPEGELLPAEDRLGNALQAILDRLLAEKKVLENMDELGLNEKTIENHRQFMQGLDIAWSLVKTESLKRQESGKRKVSCTQRHSHPDPGYMCMAPEGHK